MGIYYTAPDNPRVKLNWQPGINGIPLTPKKEDPWHERTYAVHDNGHHAFKPDLIMTTHSRLDYLLYIICRMMSEALTIIFADMFFTHGIKDKYQTLANRRIYPLFESMHLSCDSENLLETVYKTMEANVFYFILGDDSYYRGITTDTAVLDAFTEKYSEFAIADYVWTARNYDELRQQSHLQQKWYETITPLNQKFCLDLTSTEEFKMKINLPPNAETDLNLLVRTIFEYVFENNVKKFFVGAPITTIRPNNLAKAFIRYMCNQLYIFERFASLPNATIYKNLIVESLLTIDENSFTMDDIARIRAFYEEFLHECQQKNLITQDDFDTFRELYASIDPFFVSYDTKTSEPLDVVAHRLLSHYQ